MNNVYSKKLNKEQKQAVEFGSGPLLIIAGAGTGKTTVITERIKHLIIKQNIKPQEILALTFTEKASREMETRVDEVMPYGYTQMWISTFHKFCDRILRNEAIHIGLNPSYKLLSDTDATMLLKKNIFNLELDYFRPLGNPYKFISGMLQHFSRLQDEDISPFEYNKWAKNQKSKIKNQNDNEKLRIDGQDLEFKKYQELARAYQFYTDLKISENFMDFGDLIIDTLKLFRTRANILENYRQQFKFVLVDEFQDTNIAQYELIKLLCPPNHPSVGGPNLTVVGDDNQSIYKFRGAAISNILNFQKDYKKCKQIVLNKNYRSYQYILDSSYKLIKHNDPDTLEATLGISKKLKSIRENNEKLQIEFIHENRVEDEAEKVVKTIKELKESVILNSFQDPNEIPKQVRDDQNYKWSDFAILVRANTHAEPFIRALNRKGIPYQFLGPGQLFRQEEIKDLISYLQVLENFENNSAFFKVLSMEFFGINSRDLVGIATFSKRISLSIFEACEIVCGYRNITDINLPFISQHTKDQISAIIKIIHQHFNLIKKESAGQILFYFLQDSGMLKNILEYKTPIDEHQANNITKFFNKLKSYEIDHEDVSVTAVLDWIKLSMELGESPLSTDTDWTENDAVNILSVHGSKGLEFKCVFLVNLVSLRFPTTEKKEPIPIPDDLIKEVLPKGDPHLEEERRLFYVGMTRARDRLFLSAANYYGEGKREKKISPFVLETLGPDVLAKQIKNKDNQLSLLDWQSVNPETISKSTIKTVVNYLSYSQIEAFKMCPLHYKLRYILKIPSSPSPALSFGSSIHATLKKIYELVKNKQKITLGMLPDLLENNWIRLGYENKTYEKIMKQRGQKYLTEYFAKEFDPQVKVLSLEDNFIFPIKNQNRLLRIGGKIDRIDDLGCGQIEIIDYKTGRIPTKREVDSSLQMSIYALAATEIPQLPFGKKPENIKLTFYYFDTQEKISTFRTQEQLEKEKDNLIKFALEIENSDYKCSGNLLCKNCEYNLWCGV